MKKKLLLMSLAGVFVVASLGAGALAYVQYSPGATDTAMTTSELTVELNEYHANPGGGDRTKAMPGDLFAQSFYATNTGNYTEYISITMDKYWIENSQEEAMENAIQPAQETDASYLTYVTGTTDLPAATGITDTADWIFVNDDSNGEQIVAYYKKPVAPGERTSNVIDAIKVANIDSSEQALYSNLSIQIDASAAAVQQIGDVQAISDEWGITATVDSDGSLTSIH